jgi:Ca-activated chloride channel family protein
MLAAAGALTGVVPAAADEAPKVLLLLDVSGSMNAKLDSGGTKFAAAKKALKQVAAALPAGTQVGLRVYGSDVKEEQDKNPAACTDTRLVLPIGPLDATRMNAAVDSFDAQGATPIAYSMGKAVDDLGDSGKRVLILISDGQETCAKDPCPVAKKLADRGIDLQFNAIGLAVNSKARSQLQCIAKAGGGSYYDANGTDALNEALGRLTQRALRPFEVSGTPVRATADPAAAPQVGPGQYRDRYDASGTPRYYVIKRAPGSTVTASVDTVVHPSGPINNQDLPLTLTTLAGEECGRSSTFEIVDTADAVYAAAARSAFTQNTPQTSLPPGCATDPQLRLEVKLTTTGGGTVPVELVVAEQQPATNANDLPDSVGDYDGTTSRVPATTPVQPVVGGSGFSNAPQIGAGSWSDSVAYGETVLYRVPLAYGQKFRVSATVPAAGRAPVGRYDVTIDELRILTPARVATADLQPRNFGPKVVRLSLESPEVRFNNAQLSLPYLQNREPDASTASVAGDYYIALQLRPYKDTLKGVAVPVQLDVAVDGTPSGQPVFAAPPTPSAPTDPGSAASSAGGPPSDKGHSSGTTLLLAAGGGFLVAVLAGVGAWLGLSRRSARAGR